MDLKNNLRAARRKHRFRLAQKRKWYYGGDWIHPYYGGKPVPLSGEALSRIITTAKPCSCWMCGNPRKYFGEKTRQELISDEDTAHQLIEARHRIL